MDGIDGPASYSSDVHVSQANRQGVRIQPGSPALLAGLRQLVLSQEDSDVLLVSFFFQTLQKVVDSDEAALTAVEQLSALGLLQLGPGTVRVHTDGAGKVQKNSAARLISRFGPGIDRPLGETLFRIADDQRVIVLQDCPKAVALGAGSAGVVKGKQRRRNCCRPGVTTTAGRKLGEAEPRGRV